MVQPNKIEVVDAATKRFERSQAVVVVEYKGMTVEQMSNLRKKLREVNGELKVLKNRLTRRAMSNASCEAMDDLLKGPVAIAFGYGEPTGPAKVCMDFAKTNQKLVIKGGLLERKRIEQNKILALSKLPGRKELLSQMAGTMKAPARQIATVFTQAMSRIVYALSARADQMGA